MIPGILSKVPVKSVVRDEPTSVFIALYFQRTTSDATRSEILLPLQTAR